MRRTWTFGLIASWVLFLFPAHGGRADEASAREAKPLVGLLIEALAAKDAAVARAGHVGLVALAEHAAPALAARLVAWPEATRARACDTFVSMGRHARAAVDALEPKPTGEAKELFDSLIERLEIEIGFGETPARMAKRLDAIMNDLPKEFWPIDHPAIGRIAQLGREAIPRLLEYVDPQGEDATRVQALCAAATLERLCNPADIPRLGRYLEKGWDVIATVLEGMGDATAVPVLVKALERDSMSSELGAALLAFSDERAKEAAIKYVHRSGTDFEPGLRSVLDMLVAMRAQEIVPALHRMANAPDNQPVFSFFGNRPVRQDPSLMRKTVCGCALARLGEATGLPMLLDALGASGDDEWMAREAGTCLNDVTGLGHWNVATGAARARRLYRAWWLEHETALVWDEAGRVFRPQ